MTSIDWSADIAEWLTPYYDFRYTGLIGLLGFIALHIFFGFILETQTNWITLCADTFKQSDAKKNRKLKTDEAYTKKAKFYLCGCCVALLHAILASLGSFYALGTSDEWVMTVPESLYTEDMTKKWITTHSACYFLYDLVYAIADGDFMMMIHGFTSSVIFVHVASRQFCLDMALVYLFYEFSSVPLNIRSILIHTKRGDTAFFDFNQKLFFVMFILFRIVIGISYTVYSTFPVMFKLLRGESDVVPHSYICAVLFLVCCASLNLLNVIWTRAMLRVVFGAKDRKQKQAGSEEKKEQQSKKVD